MALRLYISEDHKQIELLDPLGLVIRLVNDYLQHDKHLRDPSPEAPANPKGGNLENEFERYRL